LEYQSEWFDFYVAVVPLHVVNILSQYYLL